MQTQEYQSFREKICVLDFRNFNLSLKLNINKEVNKSKEYKVKFNLSEHS